MFIRRILVATDFSVRSRVALRYAVELARTFSAEIDLLNVIPPPGRVELVVDTYLGRPMPKPDAELLAAARTDLGQLISSVPHEGAPINLLVEAGDAAATIVRMANERAADLVVLATHARTGVSELVLGSVAHRVITCCCCPVVTLRGDESRVHKHLGTADSRSES